MGVGLGLTVDEADDFGNADESTSENPFKSIIPPLLSKSASSAGAVVRPRWSWMCQSTNIAANLSCTPSESLQFPPSNIRRVFPVILQISVRTRLNTRPHVRWVSYGSTSVALPRTTIANSPRTITPVPTDRTAVAGFHPRLIVRAYIQGSKEGVVYRVGCLECG